MGCDISINIEFRKCPDEDWNCLDTSFSPPRNHQMFALLAGARDESGIVQYTARGLPSDASFQVKNVAYLDKDFHELDNFYHHHSWLNTEEFNSCISLYPRSEDEILEFQVVSEVMKFIEARGWEARAVFFFYL